MFEAKGDILAEENIYLSALSPASRTGVLQADGSAAGGPLVLGGLEYERGLGVAGSTELLYRLTQDFARLEAWAGLDSASPDGRASFQVYTDGELAFASGPMDCVSPGDTVNARRPIGVRVALTKRNSSAICTHLTSSGNP